MSLMMKLLVKAKGIIRKGNWKRKKKKKKKEDENFEGFRFFREENQVLQSSINR